MKRYILPLAVLSLFVTACNENLEPAAKQIDEEDAKIFMAYTENSADTKTYTNETRNVLWQLKDNVAIFEGCSSKSRYSVVEVSSAGTSAKMEKVYSSSSDSEIEFSANIAYYPYDADITVEDDDEGVFCINAVLPKTQTYVAESFGNDAFPMVAVTNSVDESDLSFKNVCGIVELNLTGSVTVKYISLTGAHGELLCGPIQIGAAAETVPTVTMQSESSEDSTVTLDCGKGVALDKVNATSFKIVVPPTDFIDGFTVKVVATDGTVMTKVATAENVIGRNDILQMPTLAFMADDDIDVIFDAHYYFDDGVWYNVNLFDLTYHVYDYQSLLDFKFESLDKKLSYLRNQGWSIMTYLMDDTDEEEEGAQELTTIDRSSIISFLENEDTPAYYIRNSENKYLALISNDGETYVISWTDDSADATEIEILSKAIIESYDQDIQE